VCLALVAALSASFVTAAGAASTPEASAPSLVAASPSTEVLRQWNATAQSLTIPLRPTAHGQSRGIAMVQGAVYDAVNAIDRGHQAYLLDVDALDIEPSASYDAAIATAAHHVLRAIVPQDRWEALDTAYATALAAISDGPAKNEGVRAGAAAAAAMLDDRQGDGFMEAFTFVIGTEAGDWRPATPTAVDPDPWVGYLKPFLMKSSDQFRSSGPNPLTSDEYTKEFNEVKSLGSLTSTRRTADQTTAAIFWQATPTALWNGMARELIVGHGVDTVDAARLLAMINLAAADGAVACWNDKYHWNSWRPIAAIREADTDGNPDTVADPSWRSLFDPATPTTPPLATPPFPEHPSGHGCVSGAALHAAASFFGTDNVSFSVSSSRFPGQPRHFERFSLALKEIIDARVWGGIHFRTADVEGAVIGKKVVRWMDCHYFQPVG
jgi:hypothetical protein